MKPVFRLSLAMGCLALLLWTGVAVPAETSTPWPLPASLAEAEGEWPSGPVVAEVNLPEPGSYEYSLAMETGSLPSTCGDRPCAAEEFTILEAGGIPYRLEVDSGGN